MDVRMYDNGYVRLFSPPPRCDAFFLNALLPLFPPLKGGEGGMFLCVRDTVYPA